MFPDRLPDGRVVFTSTRNGGVERLWSMAETGTGIEPFGPFLEWSYFHFSYPECSTMHFALMAPATSIAARGLSCHQTGRWWASSPAEKMA